MTEIISPSDTVEESKESKDKIERILKVLALPKKETKEEAIQNEIVEDFQNLMENAKEGDLTKYAAVYYSASEDEWHVSYYGNSTAEIVGSLEILKNLIISHGTSGG